MTTDNNHIDQLFREKLGNLEKTPPFGLMPGIKDTIIARNKIRRLNRVKTFLSIAAAMLLILMAGWITLDKDQIAGIPAVGAGSASVEDLLSGDSGTPLLMELVATSNKQILGCAFVEYWG